MSDRRSAGSAPGGATLRDTETATGWVLVDDGSVAAFGGALAWARKHGLDALHVLVEDTQPATDGTTPSGVIARRAAQLTPAPTIWRVTGRTVSSADPVPPAPEQPLGDGADAFAAFLRTHGAQPVIEHGVLVGEVLGLEVARLVCGPDGWGLEVGVGRHDRMARAELRPGQALDAALDEAVALVRARRVAGAGPHPANTLARERWLRAAVVDRPALAGIDGAHLEAVAPPLPRVDLTHPVPAPAAGTDAAGRPVLVVCSTGVDVDLVPAAADARLLRAPGARIVLAVPPGDDYPVTRDLATMLDPPAEVVAVPDGWAGTQ